MHYRISQLEFERTRSDQALELLPGIAPLIALAEQRRALQPLLPEQAKHLLTQATDAMLRSRKALETQKGVSPVVALRAAKLLSALRSLMAARRAVT